MTGLSKTKLRRVRWELDRKKQMLDAFRQVCKILQPFDPETRERILRSVAEVLGFVGQIEEPQSHRNERGTL